MAFRIVFLTQYFPPETGAAQHRLLQLAIQLKREGAHVEILTAMPNYPVMRIFEPYRRKWYQYEEINELPVHRCWIYAASSKSILPRLLNYFSFVKTSFLIGLWKIKRPDIIFCESPPLFLGITAWLLCLFKRASLVFNVSDLWPESAEKLGLVTNRYLLRVSTSLEEFLYRNAVLVTGQTQGIVTNIEARFPKKQVIWLRNGVVASEVLAGLPARHSWRKENGFAENDLLIIYAGILGHAQGLEVIIKAAALLKDRTDVKFLLVGHGPVRDLLLALKSETSAHNVYFYDNRPKKVVLKMIHDADATVVPLRKLALFEGAIPSKIFENLALQKPIFLGVSGEAKEIFIDNAGAGWYFEPENPVALAGLVRYLADHRKEGEEAGKRGYHLLDELFNPEKIGKEFFNILKNLQ